MQRTDQQRRNISAATRHALTTKRARGERVGELRYGRRVHTFDQRRVKPHPHEQRAIRRVVELAAFEQLIRAEWSATLRMPASDLVKDGDSRTTAKTLSRLTDALREATKVAA